MINLPVYGVGWVVHGLRTGLRGPVVLHDLLRRVDQHVRERHSLVWIDELADSGLYIANGKGNLLLPRVSVNIKLILVAAVGVASMHTRDILKLVVEDLVHLIRGHVGSSSGSCLFMGF